MQTRFHHCSPLGVELTELTEELSDLEDSELLLDDLEDSDDSEDDERDSEDVDIVCEDVDSSFTEDDEDCRGSRPFDLTT